MFLFFPCGVDWPDDESGASTRQQTDEHVFYRAVIGFWTPRGISARVALSLAVLAACGIFALGSRWLGVPVLAGFDGSLLLQPSPAAAIVAMAALLLVCTLVGTVLAGAVRFEAGLFAASFAMLIISYRCGTMQSVLLEGDGQPGLYWILILELLILSIILVGLWFLLRLLGSLGLARESAASGFAAGGRRAGGLPDGLGNTNRGHGNYRDVPMPIGGQEPIAGIGGHRVRPGGHDRL